MNQRHWLIGLFSLVLIAMIWVTSWASSVQPVWEWTGLKETPNHAWTIATLCDAYFGFITFYVWVLYKEQTALKRALWFIAIMTLGNMAMAIFMLKELAMLKNSESLDQLWARRNP
jgi:hypothetical protein